MLFTVLVRYHARVVKVLSVEADSTRRAIRRARVRAFGFCVLRRIDPDAVNLRIAGPANIRRVPLIRPDPAPVIRQVPAYLDVA